MGISWLGIEELYEKAVGVLKNKLAKEPDKFDFQENELEIHIINQMFGSTAGPYGGIGGSAMTRFGILVVDYPQAGICVLMVSKELFRIQKSGDWVWRHK